MNTTNTLPAMPTNYIQRAKIDADANEARRSSLEDSIHGLRSLCHSDKFRSEPYINVADVLLWAEQALSAQEDAANATYTISRMRLVVFKTLTEALENNDDSALYQLVPESFVTVVKPQPVYVSKHNLDMALEVLRADEFELVTVNEWEWVPAKPWEADGRWVYVKLVRL